MPVKMAPIAASIHHSRLPARPAWMILTTGGQVPERFPVRNESVNENDARRNLEVPDHSPIKGINLSPLPISMANFSLLHMLGH